MTNFSDYKNQVVEKLLTGELEIIQCETNNPVEIIPNMNSYDFYNSGIKTITLTCKFKRTDKDLIKELEEENRKLRGKLDSLNEILNPSQDEDYD